MKVIASYDNNTVVIIHPNLESKLFNESENDFLIRTHETMRKGKEFDIIDEKDLPPIESRPFWKGNKAKGVWIDKKLESAAKKAETEKKELESSIKEKLNLTDDEAKLIIK